MAACSKISNYLQRNGPQIGPSRDLEQINDVSGVVVESDYFTIRKHENDVMKHITKRSKCGEVLKIDSVVERIKSKLPRAADYIFARGDLPGIISFVLRHKDSMIMWDDVIIMTRNWQAPTHTELQKIKALHKTLDMAAMEASLDALAEDLHITEEICLAPLSDKDKLLKFLQKHGMFFELQHLIHREKIVMGNDWIKTELDSLIIKPSKVRTTFTGDINHINKELARQYIFHLLRGGSLTFTQIKRELDNSSAQLWSAMALKNKQSVKTFIQEHCADIIQCEENSAKILEKKEWLLLCQQLKTSDSGESPADDNTESRYIGRYAGLDDGYRGPGKVNAKPTLPTYNAEQPDNDDEGFEIVKKRKRAPPVKELRVNASSSQKKQQNHVIQNGKRAGQPGSKSKATNKVNGKVTLSNNQQQNVSSLKPSQRNTNPQVPMQNSQPTSQTSSLPQSINKVNRQTSPNGIHQKGAPLKTTQKEPSKPASIEIPGKVPSSKTKQRNRSKSGGSTTSIQSVKVSTPPTEPMQATGERASVVEQKHVGTTNASVDMVIGNGATKKKLVNKMLTSNDKPPLSNQQTNLLQLVANTQNPPCKENTQRVRTKQNILTKQNNSKPSPRNKQKKSSPLNTESSSSTSSRSSTPRKKSPSNQRLDLISDLLDDKENVNINILYLRFLKEKGCGARNVNEFKRLVLSRPDVLYEEFSGKVSKKPKAEEKVEKPKKQEKEKKSNKAKRSRTRKRKSSTPTKTPTPSPTAHEPMKDDSATQHTPPCDDAHRNNIIPNQQRALLPNGGAGDAPQEQSSFANNLETANPFFYTPHSFNPFMQVHQPLNPLLLQDRFTSAPPPQQTFRPLPQQHLLQLPRQMYFPSGEPPPQIPNPYLYRNNINPQTPGPMRKPPPR